MKIHLESKEDPREATCMTKSFFKEMTKVYGAVTCRVCKGMEDVRRGKIAEMPFGGSYDKEGKIRGNVNGERWKGKRRN